MEWFFDLSVILDEKLNIVSIFREEEFWVFEYHSHK